MHGLTSQAAFDTLHARPAGTAARFGHAIIEMWERQSQRRRARRTARALHELSDRTLHDIGLSRSEIESVSARQALSQQPCSRLFD